MCFKTQIFVSFSHKNHHGQFYWFLKLNKNSWTFHFSKALRDVKQKQRHSTKLTSLFELLLTISEILQGCPIYHVMESYWDWNYLKLCKATTCKQTTKSFWRQENTSLFMPWNFFETEAFWTENKSSSKWICGITCAVRWPVGTCWRTMRFVSTILNFVTWSRRTMYSKIQVWPSFTKQYTMSIWNFWYLLKNIPFAFRRDIFIVARRCTHSWKFQESWRNLWVMDSFIVSTHFYSCSRFYQLGSWQHWQS